MINLDHRFIILILNILDHRYLHLHLLNSFFNNTVHFLGLQKNAFDNQKNQ